MGEVCGTCQYYDEWHNGYCNKLNIEIEPEEYSCELYENGEEQVEGGKLS